MHKQITRLCRQKPFEQNTNKMLEWVMNQLEGREIELKNVLRWEDDGGKIVEVNDSTIDLHSSQLMIVHRAMHDSFPQD